MNEHYTWSQDNSKYDGHFAYKSADFKQRFSVKVLSTVGTQILATIAIVAINFKLIEIMSHAMCKILFGLAAVGAFCCIIAMCSR